MSRRKTSVVLKIVAYASIVFGVWMLAGTLFVSIRYSREIPIPIGAVIIAIAAILTLLIAGIVALKSARVGLYLYSASSMILLIRIVIQIAFGEKAQSTPIWFVFLKAGGIWLFLCLVGIAVCYHEIRKFRKAARIEETT